MKRATLARLVFRSSCALVLVLAGSMPNVVPRDPDEPGHRDSEPHRVAEESGRARRGQTGPRGVVVPQTGLARPARPFQRGSTRSRTDDGASPAFTSLVL